MTERLCGEGKRGLRLFRGSRRLMLLLRGETEEAVRETAWLSFVQNLRHELCQVLAGTRCARSAHRSPVCQRPAGKLPHGEGYTAAGLRDGVFGSTDFAGVQHEFDFGGRLAGDKLRHAAPEDVPRIVEGYFRWLCGAGRRACCTGIIC